MTPIVNRNAVWRAESPTEHKIILLLGMQGYDKHRIYFSGMGKTRYLRYQYWQQIDNDTIEYVSHHADVKLELQELYDEDCGWLISYDIKEEKQMPYFLQQEYEEDFNYKAGADIDSHTYTFTGKCVISGEDVSVTIGGKDLFRYHQGTLIQDAFPYLNKQQREWMISGVYEWENLFAETKYHTKPNYTKEDFQEEE